MSIDPGLCASCSHARSVESAKGSVFWRCARHETDPRCVKYPRLPVRECPGYAPLPPGDPTG